ncbi:MAG: cadmium-translocating P-type ATPase [Eubacteriaceae bacterium]|nr:cadmium-translocating P-type ATPase [Eubacteriaceae bacterium]
MLITLKNLTCANCSAKIERDINKLEYVKEASYNLVTQQLKLTDDGTKSLDEIVKDVTTIVNKYESGVTVIPPKTEAPKEHTHSHTPVVAGKLEAGTLLITLKDLTCANCSAKIERDINKLAYVKDASYNLVTQQLKMEHFGFKDLDGIIADVTTIVNKYESGVTVIPPEPEVKEVAKTVSRTPAAVEEEEVKGIRGFIQKFLPETIGVMLFIIALLVIEPAWLKTVLFLMAYALIGYDVLKFSFKNILKGQVFDENFLMSVATIGAIALGDYTESVAVMLFYKVGESLSEYAQQKSIRSINSLLELKVPYATVLTQSGTKQIPCEEVRINDLIVVKPGEAVPVDGKIVKGSAYVDTKSVTGESVARHVERGSEVYAGYIVTDASITLRAKNTYENSMVAKIIAMTKDAAQNKAKTEKFITTFARYYTPAVVISALLLSVIPPMMGMGEFAYWLRKGLVFLVISCPCALVLSIPLSYFASIGAASAKGILIKGATYIEALCKADTVILDKTGTVTKGDFTITEENITIDKELFKEYLCAAESLSNHPIAKTVNSSYGVKISSGDVMDYKEASGKGVSLKYKGVELKAGTDSHVETEVPEITTAGTVVYLTVNGSYAGHIVLEDSIKADSVEAIDKMKKLGIKKTYMLTGDIKKAAEAIAKKAHIDEVYSELLPDEKVDAYNKITSKGTKIYVGDGINDAPVLALSDVGIAMGALGSDAAIEAADVVVMTDKLSEVEKVIRMAKFSRKIVIQNIVFVLAIKFLFLGLSAFTNHVSMAHGVFADVGTALLATLNAMRILRKKF